MLIGIDPLLSGDALALLRDMGHGDSIVLADANFPAHYLGPPAIRIDSDLARAGRAILSVMPLDGFVDAPIQRMEIDGRPKEQNDAHREFAAMVEEVAGTWPMGSIERFRFYEEARACVAVVRHPGAPALCQHDPDQGCPRRGRCRGPAGAADPSPPWPAALRGVSSRRGEQSSRREAWPVPPPWWW